MQPPPLLNANRLLYRCSYRPEDSDVSLPYELDAHDNKHGLRSYDLRYPNPHFSVFDSVITIATTDARAGHNNAPLDHNKVTRGYETIDSKVVPFPEGDRSRQKWLREIGKYVAAVMFNKVENDLDLPFVLYDFPRDMEFYMLEKTSPDKPNEKPRTDIYLRSYSGRVFRSPLEFARHAMWLMEGAPHDKERGLTACLCKYCHRVVNTTTGRSRVAPQEPISRDLRMLAGCPKMPDDWL
ncbi:hypothetical protein PENSPDRAFT_650939 [Peniophora sp. CONT]|nr:hypothetical protein PENSPDRAFT_650939 [Peniophora sp. CONT]